MKKKIYNVIIREILSTCIEVEVEAENAQEVKEFARDEYYRENIVLTEDDFEYREMLAAGAEESYDDDDEFFEEF